MLILTWPFLGTSRFLNLDVSVNSVETPQVPVIFHGVSNPSPRGDTNVIHWSYVIKSCVKIMIIYQNVSVQTENSVHHRKEEIIAFIKCRVRAPLGYLPLWILAGCLHCREGATHYSHYFNSTLPSLRVNWSMWSSWHAHTSVQRWFSLQQCGYSSGNNTSTA